MIHTATDQAAMLAAIGEPVTIKATGQANVVVNGKFRAPQIIDLGNITSEPQVLLAAVDAAGLAKATHTLAINGINYRILRIQPETTGFVAVTLKEI